MTQLEPIDLLRQIITDHIRECRAFQRSVFVMMVGVIGYLFCKAQGWI